MPSQQTVHRLYQPRSRFMQRHSGLSRLCIRRAIDRIAYGLEGSHQRATGPQMTTDPRIAGGAGQEAHQIRVYRTSSEVAMTRALVESTTARIPEELENRLKNLLSTGVVTEDEMLERKFICPITLELIISPMAIAYEGHIERFEARFLILHRSRSHSHPTLSDVVVTDDMVFTDISYFDELEVFVTQKEIELTDKKPIQISSV